MGPIGYAVAYRTLPRADGPPQGPSRPVRSRGGDLARLTLLVLMLVLGGVAFVDGDWWLGIPLTLAGLGVGTTSLLRGAVGRAGPPGRPMGTHRPPRDAPGPT